MNPGQPASLRAALHRVPLDRLRVFEPACGPAVYLRHFGPGSLGVDRSASMCKRAREVLRQTTQRDAAYGPVDPIRQTATVAELDLDQPGWSEPLKDGLCFEAAFLCDLVMHLRTPKVTLGEMVPLLEPNAPVLSVEWTLPKGTLAAYLAQKLPGASDVFETSEHYRHYRHDELCDLFTNLGFKLETSWLHSFEGHAFATPMRRIVAPFWPVRTWLFRAPMRQKDGPV